MSASLDRLAAALSGRYRIERELGTGGMATVYLAEDLKHKRKVAIKVLKPELAAVLGADRFVQEITTTAALQHPHIQPLFDSGESDGFLWYVMPFIDGETLRGKLDRETQLGIDESVRIATDVASALHYAHTHGVIHRDIKPENILLHDGRPMVMDFGIALAVSAAAGGRMTETGMSLGTPHYMSPEQATADRDITARSDIYSLGSVLYEMLTGEPPHLGTSAQQIIMKIVTEEAQPVTRLRKSVPANVAAAIGKALEKLPADRFESAKAFAEALTNPAFTSMTAAATAAAPTTVRGWLRSPLSWAAMAVAVGGLAGLARVATRPLPDPPMRTVAIAPPDFGPTDLEVWQISSDGGLLVIGGRGMSKTALLSLEDFRLQPPVDATGGASVSISRDGKRIAGSGNGSRLMSWTLAGGLGVKLSDNALIGLPTSAWDEENRVWFITKSNNSLARVPGGGGPVETLMALDTAWIWRISHIMAGGRLAFGDRRSREVSTGLFELVAYDLAGDTARVLGDGRNPQVVGDEYLMYDVPNEEGSAAGNTIVASRFDPRRGTLIGGPLPLMTEVGSWAVSREGTFAYMDRSASTPSRVGLVPPGGAFRELPRLDSTMSWLHGVVSPQGDRLALTGRSRTNSVNESSEIWVYRLPDGPAQRLAWGGEGVDRDYPVWSQDGKRILFAHNQSEQASIYSVSADRGAGGRCRYSGARDRYGRDRTDSLSPRMSARSSCGIVGSSCSTCLVTRSGSRSLPGATATTRASRRAEIGSPTPRVRTDHGWCPCSRPRSRAGVTRSRSIRGHTPCGAAAARSSSIAALAG